MGKSAKKSASKVEAVSVVPATTKPLKKGKRGGEATIEKELVSAKKQKVVVKKLEKNVTKKKVDTSSEDGSYSSESEEKLKAKLSTKNGKVSSSSEEESGGLEEDVGVQNKTPAAAAKNGHVAKKDSESSDYSESDDGTSSDKEAAPVEKTPATVTINPPAQKDESSDGSESDDESSSDLDDNASKIAPAQKAIPAANQTAPITKEGSSSEESFEEEEESSEDAKAIPAKTPKKNATQDADVEMTDVTKTPKTPSTPKEQATGSKTLFMGNLSFSIEQADVENFFKPSGEVISVRFATRKEDDSFRGFGHVEFATPAEAQKALEELNGKDLLGRPVRLDLARERGEGERGAYTPHSGGSDAQSFQKGARSAAGQTVFVKGFDADGDEDETRSALEKHFGSCGEITRVSIPTDRETGNLRGIAYIDFTDSNGCTKALELSGSEVGGFELFVDESKPRTEGGGGRFGGRGRSGGRFDSGGRGRFGSRGRGGRGSDRGRGRGRSGGNRGRGRRND